MSIYILNAVYFMKVLASHGALDNLHIHQQLLLKIFLSIIYLRYSCTQVYSRLVLVQTERL